MRTARWLCLRLIPAAVSVAALAPVSAGDAPATRPAPVLREPAGHFTERAAAGARVVYRNDFGHEEAGPEWSLRTTDVTPVGARRFLGQFGNDRVALTLGSLPPHTFVRLSVDLYVIGTWDGNSKDPGGRPDLWRLSVEDGPTLIETSFVSVPTVAPPWQAYPDDYPGGAHPGATGAAETGTLGYSWRGAHGLSAVFPLHCVFPHKGPTVTLVFAGENLQELSDESWGLDNVKVEVLPGPPNASLTPDQLGQLYDLLRGDDAVRASQAVWALIGAGEPAVAFLRSRLMAVATADRERIRRLITDLDDDDWRVRERATEELKGMDRSIAPLLREALQAAPSPEVQWRLEAVLESLRQVGMPQWGRIRRVLEVIGTEEAKRLLEDVPVPTAPPGAPAANDARLPEVVR